MSTSPHMQPSPKTVAGVALLKDNPSMSFKTAAETVGVSLPTISTHARRAGLKRRYGPYGDPILDHELMFNLLNNKPWLTAEEVAAQVRCSPQTVRNFAKKKGMKRSNRKAKLIRAAMEAL